VYYLCDLHASQSSKGKTYDEMVRSYQVTFCGYTVFPQWRNYVNSFSLRHDENNGLFCDAIHIVYVELSKLSDVLKKPVETLTDLEKWAVFFKYACTRKHRDFVNQVIASKEALNVASTLLINISQDEHERARLRSERMYQSDLESNLIVARRVGEARGMKKGMKKGIEKGIATGIEKGRSDIVRALKALGKMSAEEIAATAGLSVEEVEKL
jgi:predicted transposase/invertase (TIGR01784 family)